MGYKYFICPDNQKCEISGCLQSCRMEKRCLSLPTLRAISQQREWTGIPSTTQLLKGTREAWLEIVNDDLIINPQDRMFSLLGTKVHGTLERHTDNMLSEERISDEVSSGQMDCYDANSMTLYDYKTAGSYKVMQALGIVMVDVPTGEVYKTGEKKGQPKTRKEPQNGQPDMREWELQLNDYRIKLESQGFAVKDMYIEAIVRDGGTIAARSRGIIQNAYLIPVRRMPDEEVKAYFKIKADALQSALATEIMPPPCTDEECWERRKCKAYCTAWEHCDIGLMERGSEEE